MAQWSVTQAISLPPLSDASRGAVTLSQSECRRPTLSQCAVRRQCRCHARPPPQTHPWPATRPCQVSVAAAAQARSPGSWSQSSNDNKWHKHNMATLQAVLKFPDLLAAKALHTDTHRHTHTRLTALFSGLPGWAGTRKVKPIWILL